MESEDEEGPEEERWRCLNTFSGYGSKGRCFLGGALLDLEIESREEDEEEARAR
jgi:hypothetical protein